MGIESMLNPDATDPEEKNENQLLIEILKSVSRIEGMMAMGAKPANHEPLALPPLIPSAQLDFDFPPFN